MDGRVIHNANDLPEMDMPSADQAWDLMKDKLDTEMPLSTRGKISRRFSRQTMVSLMGIVAQLVVTGSICFVWTTGGPGTLDQAEEVRPACTNPIGKQPNVQTTLRSNNRDSPWNDAVSATDKGVTSFELGTSSGSAWRHDTIYRITAGHPDGLEHNETRAGASNLKHTAQTLTGLRGAPNTTFRKRDAATPRYTPLAGVAAETRERSGKWRFKNKMVQGSALTLPGTRKRFPLPAEHLLRTTHFLQVFVQPRTQHIVGPRNDPRTANSKGFSWGLREQLALPLYGADRYFRGTHGTDYKTLLPGLWLGYASGRKLLILSVMPFNAATTNGKAYSSKDSITRGNGSTPDSGAINTSEYLSKVYGTHCEIFLGEKLFKGWNAGMVLHAARLFKGITEAKTVKKSDGKLLSDLYKNTEAATWQAFQRLQWTAGIAIHYKLNRMSLGAETVMPLRSITNGSTGVWLRLQGFFYVCISLSR